MSTAALIAATPSRIWAIRRSSGPRTAATMQNSLAPVAAVCSAALTSSGMSSQTERTGEVNWPDWLQKWQSSGQPPVLSETIPSTSTSGPLNASRTSWARASSSSSTSSGVCSTARIWSSRSASPRPSTCSRAAAMTARGSGPDVGLGGVTWSAVVVMAPIVSYAARPESPGRCGPRRGSPSTAGLVASERRGREGVAVARSPVW